MSELLKSAILLPAAAEFYYIFGEKAGYAGFFAKYIIKQASSRRLRGRKTRLLRNPV
jgi:hypothetical protein